MFTAQPIGFIHSPFLETSAIPKGLGARHDAEGAIELLREYEPGLLDIEGFSHLYVLWEFDRADGFDLIAHPPTDEAPAARGFRDAVAAAAEPDRADGGGVAGARRHIAARARRGYAGRHAGARHQAVSLQRCRRRN